jgi:hypothetical protein
MLGLGAISGGPPVRAGAPAVVDFETVPVGTQYGAAAGNFPGQVVLTQNGINMSVENFHLGGFTGFNLAEVGGAYDAFFPTTPLELNNISARFDFAGVGFDVNEVRLDYQEFGGSDNFSVNAGTLFELEALTNIPVNVAPGVTASVLSGEIRLLGNVDSFLIGGQELAIDNIRAIPEPGTALLLLLLSLGSSRRRGTRR